MTEQECGTGRKALEQFPDLSFRLQAVAELVTGGYRMADIGTDHSYVPICLVKACRIPGAIAADVNKGPLLRAAEHNEREEYEDVYQAFGDTATEEGFHEAASAFYLIAEVEHVHEERFAKLAELLEEGTYYGGGSVNKWICTNCGYIHEGNQAPKYCPACRHEQGYFLPYEFACYRGE